MPCRAGRTLARRIDLSPSSDSISIISFRLFQQYRFGFAASAPHDSLTYLKLTTTPSALRRIHIRSDKPDRSILGMYLFFFAIKNINILKYTLR